MSQHGPQRERQINYSDADHADTPEQEIQRIADPHKVDNAVAPGAVDHRVALVAHRG